MDSGDDEELLEEQNQIKRLEDFYQGFAYKIEIFDPLNREIMDQDGNDVATKQADLINLIREMPAVQGIEMDMPLNQGLHSIFEK